MEIGSEFNLDLAKLNISSNSIWHYLEDFSHVVSFDSGRNALKHLSHSIPSETEILFPEYICESVTNAFQEHPIRYYSLTEDFSVDLEDLKSKMEKGNCVLFFLNYFGSIMTQPVLDQIRQLADQYHCMIIEDTTHSIFSKSRTIGDYFVCSIRKWLPIPSGGILYYHQDDFQLAPLNYEKSSDNMRTYGMILKDLYLNNRCDCNELYRNIFEDCENGLDHQVDIKLMSDLSVFISSCTDVSDIVTRRRENYDYLYEKLSKMDIYPEISFSETDCPMFYVIRTKNRDQFRRYLIEHNIYCPVHWPFDGIQESSRSFALANAHELISLPIDQRYDLDHMKYMVDMIQDYGGDIKC